MSCDVEGKSRTTWKSSIPLGTLRDFHMLREPACLSVFEFFLQLRGGRWVVDIALATLLQA